MKNEVFPPIASTFSRTSSLAIKVRSLEAFTVLCGGSVDEPALEDDLSGTLEKNRPTKSSILDKYTIQEKLVPSLKVIKTKEPSVMMAALKVFREVGKVADTDFLALEILPVLWSFSLGPLLNLQQFNEFMSLIKFLSTKIETEQTRKLQELSSGPDATGFQNGSNGSFQSSKDLANSDTDNTRNTFERLVLGKDAASSANKNADLWDNIESEPSAPTPSNLSPSFPWSTNNGAMAKPTGPSGQHGFRSITPDQKLNSFPSLQPARQPSGQSPTAAPSVFPSMQPLQPTSNVWGAQPQGGSRSNPSLASLSNMAAPTLPASRVGSQQTPNYSAFSIPPPPGGMSSRSTSSSAMSMNAPPMQFSTQPKMESQPSQKQGLDKYESLI